MCDVKSWCEGVCCCGVEGGVGARHNKEKDMKESDEGAKERDRKRE